MFEDKKKVSILMPVYNTSEEFLKEAISSILNQTYSDFEFIIINDGSTNNAKDIIFSFDDSRIVYVENEQNLGVIKTLNKGLELAKGEYIARMDSDDISKPKRLEISVDFMDKNPQVSAVGCHALATPLKYKYATPCENKIIKPFLRYIANCMMHPTMLIRKSSLQKYKLRYDENYIHNEDYKLWIELNKHSQLANIPEVLLIHRIYDDAVSVKHSKMQQYITSKILWENIIEGYEKYNIFLKRTVKKYFKNEKITLFDLAVVIFVIKKVVKSLKNELDEEFYSYIETTYKTNFINFLNTAPANNKVIALIWWTDILSVIGYSNEDKVKLTQMIAEKAKNQG